MFIQTEATPNPEVIKFIPGRTVLPSGTCDFRSPEEARLSPLGLRLFAIEGVEGVFLGADFISVSRQEKIDWQHLKPAILGAIMEHFLSDEPVLAEEGANDTTDDTEEDYDPDDLSTVQAIKQLLDTRVRPVVANDGGDITFHGYRDGIVYLHMKGACAGCPSSVITLKSGVENLLRYFISEVSEVRAV